MKSKRMVRILSLVVVLSMILTTAAFAAPQNKRFEHFDKKYEIKLEDYENALKALIDKEIVKGYGNGDYGLSGNVKRGDVIVMIIRMLEEYEKINVDVDDIKEAFEDVYRYEYFYESVAKAKKLGIAKGDGKLFNPNKPVTVQETIWLIERAGNELGLDVSDGIVEDLEGIYEDELNKFAKRRDVFWMLYYVLDLVEYEKPEDDENDEDDAELTDIKLDINEENELKFVDSWFTRAYNILKNSDSDVEDLDHIKFDLPVNNGKLYYNYDADDDDNDIVEEGTKYYLGTSGTNKIDKITLVPNKDFSGTITVKYFAIDKDEESYIGYMKITVDEDELLDDISYEIDENETVTFDKDDFEDFIDKVKFELPASKIGKLYLDDDNDNKAEDGESLGAREEVKYDDLDNIIFVPYQDYDGKVVIKYSAIKYVDDEENETYHGEVVITVGAVQEITTLKFNANYNDDEFKIDFLEKLEMQVDDDDLFEDLDNVKFALPEDGTLKIKLKEQRLSNVDANISYELNKIEYIKYVFDSKGVIDLNYTVYDDNTTVDKAYDGKFTLTIR